jgi:hypothetical protein
MPYTDRKIELKAKTSVAQTASQAAVYAKGLNGTINNHALTFKNNTVSNQRLDVIHIARHSVNVKSEFGRTFFPPCVFRGGLGSIPDQGTMGGRYIFLRNTRLLLS